jgi:DNA-binding protein YbaB
LFEDDILESALAEFHRTKEIADRIRAEGSQVTVQASDRNKVLSLTVNGKGDVQELKFRGDAYRDLAPAELADLIVKTIERARRDAQGRARAGRQELLRGLPQSMGRLAEVRSAEELVEAVDDLFARNMPDGGRPLAPPRRTGEWT